MAYIQLAPLVVVGSHRQHERAERLRQTTLDQLAVRGFGEYFDPFTGQLLGSANKLWTTTVALEWLAYDAAWEERLAS